MLTTAPRTHCAGAALGAMKGRGAGGGCGGWFANQRKSKLK